jgi:hypothetical protein
MIKVKMLESMENQLVNEVHYTIVEGFSWRVDQEHQTPEDITRHEAPCTFKSTIRVIKIALECV